jgi:hypothetical protein
MQQNVIVLGDECAVSDVELSYSGFNTRIQDLLLIVGAFPHVRSCIESQWGTREAAHYMNSLITMDRNDRSGFPFAVVMAISELLDIHNNKFNFNPTTTIWSDFLR